MAFQLIPKAKGDHKTKHQTAYYQRINNNHQNYLKNSILIFVRNFDTLLAIRNLNSSKLADSSIFRSEFAHWLNLLHDYTFGILKNYSDLALKLARRKGYFVFASRLCETKTG